MIKTLNIEIGEEKKPRKRYVRSLEYELIASLAMQKYSSKGGAAHEELLSIPLNDRIPGLISEYGIRRMHGLIRTILAEFCICVPLPKSKKLSETKVSVVACDLILVAQEDQLSLEDFIVFFELAKAGKWGKFKHLLTHFAIMEKLDAFREERYQAYLKLKSELEAELKLRGPQERISPEPTPIKKLFVEKGARIIPFRSQEKKDQTVK